MINISENQDFETHLIIRTYFYFDLDKQELPVTGQDRDAPYAAILTFIYALKKIKVTHSYSLTAFKLTD